MGIGDGFKANSEPATLSMSASACSCSSIGTGVALLALEWEGVGEGDGEMGRGSSGGVGDGVGVGRISDAGSTVVSCWLSGSRGLKSSGCMVCSLLLDALAISSGFGTGSTST